jgi:hypothetical protein
VSGRFSVQVGSANGFAGWICVVFEPMEAASSSELAAKYKFRLTSYLLLPLTYPIFRPTSEPETAIDKVLDSVQLRNETAIQCTEDLKLNYLSVEVVPDAGADIPHENQCEESCDDLEQDVPTAQKQGAREARGGSVGWGRERGRAGERAAAERRPHRGRFHQRDGGMGMAIRSRSRWNVR